VPGNQAGVNTPFFGPGFNSAFLQLAQPGFQSPFFQPGFPGFNSAFAQPAFTGSGVLTGFSAGTPAIPQSGFSLGGPGANISSVPFAANPFTSGFGFPGIFPNYGYGYYSLYPYVDFSGYLTGAASVINSQGNYMVSAQQSRLIKEQVNREKIENRRRVFEQ